MLQATKIPTLALAMDEPQMCIQKHIDSRVEVATSNGLWAYCCWCVAACLGAYLILQISSDDFTHAESATCMISQLGVTIPGKFQISSDKLSWAKRQTIFWSVVWNNFYFPIYYGNNGNVIIPIDFHMFQTGWNHQAFCFILGS